MFRACHAHHQEKQIVSIQLLVELPTSTRHCHQHGCTVNKTLNHQRGITQCYYVENRTMTSRSFSPHPGHYNEYNMGVVNTRHTGHCTREILFYFFVYEHIKVTKRISMVCGLFLLLSFPPAISDHNQPAQSACS